MPPRTDDDDPSERPTTFQQVHLACELVYPTSYLDRMLVAEFADPVDRTLRDACLALEEDRNGAGDVLAYLWRIGRRDPALVDALDTYTTFVLEGLPLDARRMLADRSGRGELRKWGTRGSWSKPDLDDGPTGSFG